MTRPRLIMLLIFLALATAVGGWYGAHWLQLKRADSLLLSANGHIEAANRHLSEVRVGDLGQASFSSLDGIARGAEAAGAALPLLEQARLEAQAAALDVRRARGLILLPEWYRDYLGKKEEIAALRIRQLDTLGRTAENLRELFDSGPVIFSAVEEMDRLLGRFQAAMGRLKDDPAGARATLEEVAGSMRGIRDSLDQAYQKHDFQLLLDLSSTVSGNAELVEAAAQLADATAAEDQARAQKAAAMLERKLLDSGIGRDDLDMWWQANVEALGEEYNSLQSRQEELEAEAAAIYTRERRP